MKQKRDVSVEQVIREICASVAPHLSGLPDANTTLGQLGLDSLGCADVAVAVEERFGVRLADADVSEGRTILEIAELVRGEVSPWERIPPGLGRWQPLTKSVLGPILSWWLRLEVVGDEHVPNEGAVILAANHRSMMDIPLHVLSSPRPLTFMAKRELFGDPVRRWLWRILGGFPVRRDRADLRAIDTAVALLDQGEALGIYPEGTRSFTGEMLPFLKGAAWLSLRTGVPIVPCGISGTGKAASPGFGRRRRVRVRFGPPIPAEREGDPLARRARAERMTEELLAAITALMR